MGPAPENPGMPHVPVLLDEVLVALKRELQRAREWLESTACHRARR